MNKSNSDILEQIKKSENTGTVLSNQIMELIMQMF
jgi:hypothetical protein